MYKPLTWDEVKGLHPLVEQDVVNGHILRWQEAPDGWVYGADAAPAYPGTSVLLRFDKAHGVTAFYEELEWCDRWPNLDVPGGEHEQLTTEQLDHLIGSF